MSILYNVHVVASRTDTAMAERLTDMSPPDFALYSLIITAGPISPRQISRRHGMVPSSVSAALARLESAGHVRRHEHPTDQRTFLVELTEDGAAAHEKAREQFMGVLTPLVDELGPDLETVRFGLRRLAAALGTLQGLDDQGNIDGITDDGGPHVGIDYRGPALSPDEQQSVREHIDYLMWRRARRE